MSAGTRTLVVEGVCIVRCDSDRSWLEWMPGSPPMSPREIDELVPLPPVRDRLWYALTGSDVLPAGHMGRVKITVECQPLPADESRAAWERFVR